MGWAWHAKSLFWIVEQFFKVFGSRLFSNFRSLSDVEFRRENSKEVQMRVYDEQVIVTDIPIYTIRFQYVPELVVRYMESVTLGTREERLFIGLPSLCLSIFGVISSVIFAYKDPSRGARYFWLMEQIAVA